MRTVAYEIERFFENARAPFRSLEASVPHLGGQHADRFHGSKGIFPLRTLTFAEVCKNYLNDPTPYRTRKSAVVYRATYVAFAAIFGSEVQAASITRAMCREALSVLQSLPANASKRWPNLTLREVSAKASDEAIQRMSVANVNEYLGGVTDGAVASHQDAIALGAGSKATAQGGIAIGGILKASFLSVALGYGAESQPDYSVALGYCSVSDRANTVSIGLAAGTDNPADPGVLRQLTNLAAGAQPRLTRSTWRNSMPPLSQQRAARLPPAAKPTASRAAAARQPAWAR